MIPLVEASTWRALDRLRFVEDAFAASNVPSCDLTTAVRGTPASDAIEKLVGDASRLHEFDRLINREMVRHAQRFFAIDRLEHLEVLCP